MDEGYHIDPEEWGRHKQLVEDIHEAIAGDSGVLAQFKILNGRVRSLEAWSSRLKGAGFILLGVVGFLGMELFKHLTQ